MIICGYSLCHVSQNFGMTILYVNVYIIGFFFKYKNIVINPRYTFILIPIALIIRVIVRLFMDGTVFYDCLVVFISHMILTLSIFTLGKNYLNIKSNRFINWLDDISYFVYIVHYMFMVGPVRTMGITNSLLINTIITLVLSIVSAMVLQRVYRLFINEIMEL